MSFKKNQKKIVAIVMAILMVAFIYQLGAGSSAGRQPRVPIGKFAGAPLYSTDKSRATRDLEILRTSLGVPNYRTDALDPAMEGILRNHLIVNVDVSKDKLSDTDYMLLVKEAAQNNIVVSDDTVEATLSGLYFNGKPVTELDPETRSAVASAVRDFLSVIQMLELSTDAVRVSTPRAVLYASSDKTKLSLIMKEFSAADYFDFHSTTLPATSPATAPATRSAGTRPASMPTTLPAGLVDMTAPPTAIEITHFNNYRNSLPMSPEDIETNPFGFGYKVPNQASLDYILLNQSDIRDRISFTERAIYRYYKLHQEKYDRKPTTYPSQFDLNWRPAAHPDKPPFISSAKGAPPAPAPFVDRPATSPATVPATAPASQPSPLTASMSPFSVHHDEIRENMLNEFTGGVRNSLLVRMITDINGIMTSDYGAYAAAIREKKPIPPSTVGVAYSSYDYLLALQKHVQEMWIQKYPQAYKDFTGEDIAPGFAVLPTVALVPLRTREDLARDSVLGSAYLPQSMQAKLPDYVFEFSTPFLAADKIAQLRASKLPVIDVWQPSMPMGAGLGFSMPGYILPDGILVFRIEKAVPAYPVSNIMDPDPDQPALFQVRFDIEKRTGFEKARVAADKFLAAAQQYKSVQQAANGAGAPDVITTKTFARTDANIGLGLPNNAEAQLIKQAFELYEESIATNNPRLIKPILLQRAGRIYIAELNQEQVQPLRDDDDLANAMNQARIMIAASDITPIAREWFSHNNIRNRLDWKPSEKEREDNSASSD